MQIEDGGTVVSRLRTRDTFDRVAGDVGIKHVQHAFLSLAEKIACLGARFMGRDFMNSFGTSIVSMNSKNSSQAFIPGRFESTTSPVLSSRVM